MNIGIVIGVSEYQNTTPLDGCLNDANVINQLLELSNKCSDILYLTEKTDSKNVKSKISSFVNKYQNEDIDEVIFYFTGHGLFEDDEFYYILTDYNDSKKKQTSLENSELDRLLRSLSASLTIKIVDACQSGTRYIKDPESFQKYLNKSEQSFDKCYFYYSSQNDQYSYQDNSISDFTLSFINTFIKRPNQDVRYKDISDTLADEFSSNPRQTPFFVMQGSYTELFGYISNDVANALNKIISSGQAQSSKPAGTHKTLLQLVESQASLYCNEAEAYACVEQIGKIVSDFSFSEELGSLFSFGTSTLSDSNIPINTAFAGEYLSKSDIDYFVKTEKETQVRMVPKGGRLATLMATRAVLGEEVPMEKKKYVVIVGAKSTVALPYDHVFLKAEAKYPNINDTGCIILPYVSQTKIAILAAFFTYRSREWGVKEINQSSCVWNATEENIKEATKIESQVQSILERYSEFTLKPIQKGFGLLQEEKEEEEEINKDGENKNTDS